MASRPYEAARKEIDWDKMPYPETPVDNEFVVAHHELIEALSFAICDYAAANRLVVDSDVRVAVDALAGTYRTLASGIYYERRPDYLVQRELYERISQAIQEFKKTESQRTLTTPKDSEVYEALVFLVQLAYIHDNGRPKCRALLDVLRGQFAPGTFEKPASKLVLLP